MSIIAVANLKGGVGKSTLSQNLGVFLAKSGRSVCIVDTDTEQKSTIEWNERRAKTGLQQIPVFLFDEKSLASKASEEADNYDFVIIDGSPALSEITTKIVLIADLVMVPVMPSVSRQERSDPAASRNPAGNRPVPAFATLKTRRRLRVFFSVLGAPLFNALDECLDARWQASAAQIRPSGTTGSSGTLACRARSRMSLLNCAMRVACPSKAFLASRLMSSMACNTRPLVS